MSAHCCNTGCPTSAATSPAYRKALWIAFVVNAAMFAVEIAGSLHSGSVSLLADSADFASDAANYAISLAVFSMGLMWRSRAAIVKGAAMTAFGLFVLAKAVWSASAGAPPEPATMGLIGLFALFSNAGVALMLYAFREGDASMRSVWLCSRNDAIGNIAVMLAAFGVFGTGSGWPDLLVAVIMGALALSSGISVIRHANSELAHLAVVT